MRICVCDEEGERLAVQVRVCLPVRPPVPPHYLPSGARALCPDCLDRPGPAHVPDKNQVEVAEAVYGEPDAAFLYARDPTRPIQEFQE